MAKEHLSWAISGHGTGGHARHRLASSVLCKHQTASAFLPGVGCGPASDTKSKAKKAPARSLPGTKVDD
eukprot:1013937-Prymnesium_polylepis.1